MIVVSCSDLVFDNHLSYSYNSKDDGRQVPDFGTWTYNMEKKYQIFVSSPYEDLKEERATVITALLKAGYIPTGMEYFTATSKSQWEVIEEIIPQCDYYVVIVAGKYGSIEPTSGISYTEKEYDLAVNSGVPTIGFLIQDIDALQHNKVEGIERRAKLDTFREKIKSRMCDFWTNKDELSAKVLASLHKEVNTTPREGWVRASQVSNGGDLFDISFFDAVVDLHIEHTSNPFDEKETVTEKSIISVQWGELLEKVCGLLTVPYTFEGAITEISFLLDGVTDSDVRMIINTFVSKKILEVGCNSVEGLGVQNYCTVTTLGHQVLAEYVTKTNSELALRDRQLLNRIMKCFSTRLMDDYLREGPEYIYHDFLTSFEMCEAIVSASSFTLYGETLKSLWNTFYISWKEAMSHPEWYFSTNTSRYRFHGLQSDMFVTKQDEMNFNHLVDNCKRLASSYMDFIGYVKDTCRINVDATSNTFEAELSKKESKI